MKRTRAITSSRKQDVAVIAVVVNRIRRVLSKSMNEAAPAGSSTATVQIGNSVFSSALGMKTSHALLAGIC